LAKRWERCRALWYCQDKICVTHTYIHHVARMDASHQMCVCGCVCVSHQTYEWVSDIWEWVMSHIWMRHVTYMNESCHTYKWVMSHIWMSHVTHMDESCHTYGCVMSHRWMSHVTYMNESCHIYGCVMSHIWMSHVTHMNESFHI